MQKKENQFNCAEWVPEKIPSITLILFFPFFPKILDESGFRQEDLRKLVSMTEDFSFAENEDGSDEIIRVRLPNERNREMFGYAELMMGANHIHVKCFDGITRMGRIKGKIKEKSGFGREIFLL